MCSAFRVARSIPACGAALTGWPDDFRPERRPNCPRRSASRFDDRARAQGLAARDPDADEPDAQERAWAVIRAAHRAAETRAARRRRRATLPAVAVLASLAILIVAVGSAPRQAVARWVRDAIGLTVLPHARSTLGPLPTGGQVLVNAHSGVWIVTSRRGATGAVSGPATGRRSRPTASTSRCGAATSSTHGILAGAASGR